MTTTKPTSPLANLLATHRVAEGAPRVGSCSLREHRHRPYYAGLVLGTVGLDETSRSGLTPEIIQAVTALTGGAPNDKESEAWLRLAYNVCCGYAAARAAAAKQSLTDTLK